VPGFIFTQPLARIPAKCKICLCLLSSTLNAQLGWFIPAGRKNSPSQEQKKTNNEEYIIVFVHEVALLRGTKNIVLERDFALD
jgi:hypothetical protein